MTATATPTPTATATPTPTPTVTPTPTATATPAPVARDGGHRLLGATSPSQRWYFAEGYTGPDSDEYLLIFNPSQQQANLTITYYLGDGATIDKALTVLGHSRATVAVHGTTDGVGRDQAVSAVVTTAAAGIVVERQMSVRAGPAITGESAVLGATEPTTTWYFAAGDTAAGSDEYLTLFNPAVAAATAQITYYREGGQPLSRSVAIPARSRRRIAVHDTVEGVGRGERVAARVVSDTPIVAERSLAFRYSSGALADIDGIDMAVGATATAGQWLFAEADTTDGRDTYLAILNPNDTDAAVNLLYQADALGPPIQKTVTVPAGARATVAVHDDAAGVGRGHAVAVRATTTNPGGIVVERMTYFRAGGVTDGASTLGAPDAATVWYVAGGDTRAGVDEYLILTNLSTTPASGVVSFYREGVAGPVSTRNVIVQPGSRTTIAVHAPPPEGIGRNGGAGDRVALMVDVSGTAPLVVERAMFVTAPAP